MNRVRSTITILLFMAILFSLSFVSWFKSETLYSDSERRGLQRFPELTVETLFSGSFTSSFETYTQDQFPLRDVFRKIKAMGAFNLFQKQDNNDIVIDDDSIYKLEYPLNESMLDHAADRFENIYNTYLKDTDVNVYFSIVPDKNYYADDSAGLLKLDYNHLFEHMKENTPFMTYLDIASMLTIDDFYRTDTHWRQEKITDVADYLLKEMNTESDLKTTEVTLNLPFYGVYHGQSALNIEPDSISYLMSESFEQCEVISYSTGTAKPIEIYNMSKASGKDAYELFLNGAEALIEITNPNAKTDKELILFRDSFGSSLAPLLIDGYAKITLVDIRYMQSSMLGDFIEFDQQDVLFMYSTLLLNSSLVLK